MNDTVIKVENLSKSYLIGHQSQEKYLALRDVIAGKAKSLGSRLIHPFKSSAGGLITADETEEFWALKDINFEVKRGDRVGIIGRNGAGKSTLLKVLSRITEPTSGRIEIDGRVASLLEVGTGFHPELTGRENIFLNGAILGMSRVEVKRKFDEIVDFAEVEKFLDTPVKRYSSGMYVRLAFAVAAHLEPEILIVDEVLAVGDAQFQKKCLGKMEEVGKQGRTVLFVSHQLDMVKSLCGKAYLLSGGELVDEGFSDEVVERYLKQSFFVSCGRQEYVEEENDDLPIQILKASLYDKNFNKKNIYDAFEDIFIEIIYIVRRQAEGLIVNFGLSRNNNFLFYSFDADDNPEKLYLRKIGKYKSLVRLPTPYLKAGSYSVTIGTGIANVRKIQQIDDAIFFDIEILSKDASLLGYAERRPGVMSAPLCWSDIEFNWV